MSVSVLVSVSGNLIKGRRRIVAMTMMVAEIVMATVVRRAVRFVLEIALGAVIVVIDQILVDSLLFGAHFPTA